MKKFIMIALAAFSLIMVSCGDKKGSSDSDSKEKKEVKMVMGVYDETVVEDLCERMIAAIKANDEEAGAKIDKEGTEYIESLTWEEQEKAEKIIRKYQEKMREAIKAAGIDDNEDYYSSYDDDYDMDDYDMDDIEEAVSSDWDVDYDD